MQSPLAIKETNVKYHAAFGVPNTFLSQPLIATCSLLALFADERVEL